jgi:hypothetical protein
MQTQIPNQQLPSTLFLLLAIASGQRNTLASGFQVVAQCRAHLTTKCRVSVSEHFLDSSYLNT